MEAATGEAHTEGQGTSLAGLFGAAWRKQRAFEEAGSDLQEALAAWERCQARLHAHRSDLFSRNERLDDFNTSSLRYLLVPYYLGRLLMEKPGLAERAANLKRAQMYFTSYLTELERHEGLSREDLNAWHRERPLAPTARRTEKIDRARRERELQQAITHLQKQGAISRDEDDDDEVGDEEIEREIWMRTLQLAAVRAVNELEAISQELPLAERLVVSETARELDAKREQQERPKTQQQETKLAPLGEGMVLSHDRERKQRDVFRPSWNQPTMSVEDAAALEMRFAAKSSPTIAKDEADEEEESDEDVYKKREWDDYKDDHPAGWGNRMRQG